MAVFSSFVEITAMLFRTELHPKSSDFKINHSAKILSIGSCFADCLGVRFEELQFDILSNPFGVLYNPISIFGNLVDSLSKSKIDESQVVEMNGVFFHYQYHSEIKANSKEGIIEKIASTNRCVEKYINHSGVIFITLGTAFVYYLKDSKKSVANCHKMPAKIFEKRMLSVEEIVQSFTIFNEQLKSQNPNCKVFMTVSPVRHTKDTLELNSVSKAILRLAAYQIAEKSENVSYFPSFEIMMDDLRDYRFFKEDMIHPTTQAETYIWEKFANAYFSEETILFNKEIREIQSALSHRPFDTESSEYNKFLKKYQERVLKLNDKIAVPRLLEKMALKLSA